MGPLLYFSSFESICLDFGVPPQAYLGIMHAHAYGELSDLMGELPDGDQDYQQFKKLVRQCFGLSED